MINKRLNYEIEYMQEFLIANMPAKCDLISADSCEEYYKFAVKNCNGTVRFGEKHDALFGMPVSTDAFVDLRMWDNNNTKTLGMGFNGFKEALNINYCRSENYVKIVRQGQRIMLDLSKANLQTEFDRQDTNPATIYVELDLRSGERHIMFAADHENGTVFGDVKINTQAQLVGKRIVKDSIWQRCPVERMSAPLTAEKFDRYERALNKCFKNNGEQIKKFMLTQQQDCNRLFKFGTLEHHGLLKEFFTGNYRTAMLALQGGIADACSGIIEMCHAIPVDVLRQHVKIILPSIVASSAKLDRKGGLNFIMTPPNKK